MSHLLKTKFTKLTGCQVPIQQAGMGDIANPSLAAAVANAGALGMIGAPDPYQSPVRLERWLDETRKLTKGIFGVNFIVAEQFFPELSVIRDSVELASKTANVVEFFYRKPESSLVELVHKGGALVSWQVGSKEEAKAAAEVGCDIIVAQGIEAGGHIRGKLGLVTVLNEIAGSIDAPVLAAGGIGSGRAMAAALTTGASGVRVGTRFVAAQESGAHPEYVQALINSKAQDTVFTEAFSVGWPNAPHRVLCSCIDEAEAFNGDLVGKRDPYNTGKWEDVHRFQSFAITKEVTGTIKAMPHWAGEGVGEVKRVQNAADIVMELSNGAEEALRASSLLVT
jgi:nitronate monooxygenase